MPTIYFWSSILIHRNIRFSFTFIIRPISTFVSKWFSVIFRNDFRSSDFFFYSPAGRRTFLVDLIRFFDIRPAPGDRPHLCVLDRLPRPAISLKATNRHHPQIGAIFKTTRSSSYDHRKTTSGNHLVTWTNRRRRWPPIQLKADLPDGHERSVF